MRTSVTVAGGPNVVNDAYSERRYSSRADRPVRLATSSAARRRGSPSPTSDRTASTASEASPNRPVAVCRELTKHFEEVVRGSAGEVAGRFAEAPKGEIVLVLGPAEARSEDDPEAVAVVRELVEEGLPRRRAAGLVERLTGRSARELYRRSL